MTLATLLQNRIQVQLSQGLATFSGAARLRGRRGNRHSQRLRSSHPARGVIACRWIPPATPSSSSAKSQAQVSTSQGSTTVNKGELICDGTGDDTAYQTSRASGNDSWDDWNRDRDNIIQNADGVRRTNPYYTGAGDLDPYGSWSDVPDYGPVWIPRVDAGWATAWPLGLGALLRMDVGFLRSLGLGAVSLRTLVPL